MDGQSSLRDGLTFVNKFFLPSLDHIFTSVELSRVGCSDLLEQLGDVTTALTDLLGQIVDLHSLLQLSSQVVLLILVQVSLVFQVLVVLQFSIVDVYLVEGHHLSFDFFQGISLVFLYERFLLLQLLSFALMHSVRFVDVLVLILSDELEILSEAFFFALHLVL